MKLPGKGMGWKEFGKALYSEWNHDQVGNVAAALTFFGVLALVPFLLFLVSLASLIIQPSEVGQIVGSIGRGAPADVTHIIGGEIQSISGGQSVGLLTVSIIGTLWSASGAMVSLQQSLNTIYDVREERPFWKTRGIAIGMTVVCAILLLAAGLIAVATTPVANAVGGALGTVILWLRFPVAGLLVMFIWALMYWALPDVEQKFKFITPGSIVGVVLWIAASIGFSIYVSNFGHYEATYGALGGVIVLLLWMWISSQVVLLGAEINAVIEHKSPEGKRPGAKKMEQSGTEPVVDHGAAKDAHVPGAEAKPNPPSPPPRAPAPPRPELAREISTPRSNPYRALLRVLGMDLAVGAAFALGRAFAQRGRRAST
jgi:membrane protein